jgi:hypothetical protein
MAEPGDYRLIKCEVCGHPWIAHPPECTRHAYRPGGEPLTVALDGAIPTLEDVLARTEIVKQKVEASRRIREDLEIGPSQRMGGESRG